MARFAAYSLEPLSPLHLGSRRAGVVAQTHRHAPGHLFTFALAAAVGMRRGASADIFQKALDEVMRRFHFAPAFFFAGEEALSEAEVERRLVASSHHVSLALEHRAAVDGALFEVESLQPRPGVTLRGGVWLADDGMLDGRPLSDWFSEIRLGGELKTGSGRVRCAVWDDQARHYPGVGPVSAQGVWLEAGTTLPGAALDGVANAPLVPWLGRRHDPVLGFGRRLSQAGLVRIGGTVVESGHFIAASGASGLGCWEKVRD